MRVAVFFFVLAAIFALLAIWQAKRQKRRPAAASKPGERQEPTAPQPKSSPSVIELSNFAGSKALRLKAEREARYEAAVQHYEQAAAHRLERIDLSRRELIANWRHREFWLAFKAWLDLRRAKRLPVPRPPVLEEPSKEELQYAAGEAGESRLSLYLRERLDRRWTILHGYKNRLGEIDILLVGPKGVFAFEVKAQRGVFHTDGSRWWYDKYDNYGNLVEQALPLADKGDRGPDRQLNEPANLLEKFLESRGCKVLIMRAIVLVNERARLGEMRDVGVHLVAPLAALDLDRLFARSGEDFDQATVERIVALVQKDHAWHSERNKARVCGKRTGTATTPKATYGGTRPK